MELPKKAFFEYQGLSRRVVDGDTIEVIVDLGFKTHHIVTLRLARINSPERLEAFLKYEAAKQFVEETIKDKILKIRTYKADSFGRYIADIWLPNDECLNDFIVANGHAVYYDHKKLGDT